LSRIHRVYDGVDYDCIGDKRRLVCMNGKSHKNERKHEG
jgi:hypothetical protein